MDTALPRHSLQNAWIALGDAQCALDAGDGPFYAVASLVQFGREVADLLDRIPEPQDNGGRRPSEGIAEPAAEASPAAPSLREQVADYMHTVFPGTQWPVQFDRILALISDEDARRDAEIARLKDELSVARFVAMDAAQKIKAQVALLKEGIK